MRAIVVLVTVLPVVPAVVVPDAVIFVILMAVVVVVTIVPVVVEVANTVVVIVAVHPAVVIPLVKVNVTLVVLVPPGTKTKKVFSCQRQENTWIVD